MTPIFLVPNTGIDPLIGLPPIFDPQGRLVAGFTEMKGGAYLFVPSISLLKEIAEPRQE